jgi:hypothetical protein
MSCLKKARVVEFFYGTADGGTRFREVLEKREDGTGRHFVRTEIIISPKLMTSVRPENGTFYDGTAALNT